MTSLADPGEIAAPGVYRAKKRRRRAIMQDLTASAAQAIGELSPGCEIFGFTKGQFSFIDLLEHVLNQTGPVRASVSTWTASNASIDRAFELFNSGKLETCRFLLDAGFKARQPEFCDLLIRKFGIQSIRTTRNHAKFFVFRNDRWNIVVRTSMNLNSNPRLENFEISDDLAMADFVDGIVDDVFKRFGPDDNFVLTENAGLGAIANHGVTEADIMAVLDRSVG